MSIILILIGIFIFSSSTAAISSFLTDRILEDDNKDIKEEIDCVIEKSDNIINDLQSLKDENKQLKDEINELKYLIMNKMD